MLMLRDSVGVRDCGMCMRIDCVGMHRNSVRVSGNRVSVLCNCVRMCVDSVRVLGQVIGPDGLRVGTRHRSPTPILSLASNE